METLLMLDYLVYAISCPETNIIKYIGITRDLHERFNKHRKGHVNPTKELCLNLKEKKLKTSEALKKYWAKKRNSL
jgi:predicted GIY-YIG superfamily endonuclease